MKNKLIFLIFFVICLIGVSVYADICCFDYTQDKRCNDDCQETSCGPNMVFNKDPKVCKCECGGEQSCEENYTWNQEKCACECTGEQSCGDNKTWNKDSCSCECSGEQSCGENQTWDSEQCKCVCTEVSCTGGKTQNKDTCACECPEGQEEVGSGQCCASDNIATGYGGIRTCCNAGGGYAQSTPQCCEKNGGSWLSGESGSGRCCGPNESAHGDKECCRNCCVKDGSGNITPMSSGVDGTSTGRVTPECCEAAGGEYAACTGGVFYGGICCKGSKDIAHGNSLNKTCCENAGGSIKNGKCCKCPSGGC